MADTTPQVGDVVRAPGFWTKPAYTDDELLASSEGGFTQFGCTLAPGQGALPVGTPLVRITTAGATLGMYKKSVNDSTDGPLVTGFLRTAVDTGSSTSDPVHGGNIVVAGILKYDRIKAALAGSDLIAASVTALNARVDSVRNYLFF